MLGAVLVIWAGNLEFIHHMAEIALLRDLYRTRSTGSTGAVVQGAPTHGPSTARLTGRAADRSRAAGVAVQQAKN